MSRTKTLLLLGLFSSFGLIQHDLRAQVSFGGKPWAQHAEKLGLGVPQVFSLPALDRAALLAEDDVRAAAGTKRQRFGVNHATQLDLNNSGTWSTLPNGDRIWRLQINLEAATSVNLEFDDFVVPEGGMVYIYTPRGERLGGFTKDSNPGHTVLGVGLLPGGEVTIEYNEPAAKAGQGRLRIGQITQGYRDSFNMMKDFNESLSCNNNVICPEGDPWRDQIRSVARIVVGGSDWCTGTLINNCANDGTPYFLTANHCLNGSTATWVFAFNWESPQCATNQNTPMTQTVSGAQLLENNPGTDMALLQLNTAPPAAYEVYYSGWDASGAIPQDQVGIHHPSGDQKKISFNGETSEAVMWGGANCWEVDAWDDGTTEGGSSGSGLWNEGGRLVGQLYGGTFGCNCTDAYGRFDLSFPVIEDHMGSCGLVLDGYDPNQPTVAVDGAVQAISNIPAILCNSSTITPSVTIRNAGTDPLTSLVLSWEVSNGGSGEQTWTGTLGAGATTTVTLPSLNTGNGSQTFTVTASQPNGITDPNSGNNSRSTDFHVADPGTEVDLTINLDDYGTETTWQVRDNGGTVLYSGGPYENDATEPVQQTLCLALGCYTLEVLDEYGDGICCDYGNGNYNVSYNNAVLVTGNGQFDDSIEHTFCLTSAGIQGRTDRGMNVRPNPTTGRIDLRLPDEISGLVELELFDGTGRRVQAFTLNVQGMASLDLGMHNPGIYLLKAKTHARSFTECIVLH